MLHEDQFWVAADRLWVVADRPLRRIKVDKIEDTFLWNLCPDLGRQITVRIEQRQAVPGFEV